MAIASRQLETLEKLHFEFGQVLGQLEAEEPQLSVDEQAETCEIEVLDPGLDKPKNGTLNR
jgi:hypothetical protein